MSKRKKIFKKLNKSIQKNKEMLKDDSYNIIKKEEADDKEFERAVPEEFKKQMDSFSKEELITELFFCKYELMQVKRELEMTTFKLTRLEKDG